MRISYGAKNLCEVCWEKASLYRCARCGRNVCEDHLSSRDTCIVCGSLVCSICRRNLAVASCMICGRIACYRCFDKRYNSLVCMMCRIGLLGLPNRYVALANK